MQRWTSQLSRGRIDYPDEVLFFLFLLSGWVEAINWNRNEEGRADLLEGGVNVCFEEEKFDRIQRDCLVPNPASDTCSSVTLNSYLTSLCFNFQHVTNNKGIFCHFLSYVALGKSSPIWALVWNWIGLIRTTNLRVAGDFEWEHLSVIWPVSYKSWCDETNMSILSSHQRESFHFNLISQTSFSTLKKNDAFFSPRREVKS